MKKIIFVILLTTLIFRCSSPQKIILTNPVDNSRMTDYNKTIITGDTIEGELDAKDPVISMDKTFNYKKEKYITTNPYNTPFDCYKTIMKTGFHRIKVTSWGNMSSFGDTTMMIPVIKAVDASGKEIPFNVSSDNNAGFIVKPENSKPAGIDAYFDFDLKKDLEIYIIIFADMSSEKRTMMGMWPDTGIISFPAEGRATYTYPYVESHEIGLMRTPFAKYEIKFDKD